MFIPSKPHYCPWPHLSWSPFSLIGRVILHSFVTVLLNSIIPDFIDIRGLSQNPHVIAHVISNKGKVLLKADKKTNTVEWGSFNLKPIQVVSNDATLAEKKIFILQLPNLKLTIQACSSVSKREEQTLVHIAKANYSKNINLILQAATASKIQILWSQDSISCHAVYQPKTMYLPQDFHHRKLLNV